MRKFPFLLLLLAAFATPALAQSKLPPPADFNEKAAERFARLALACVHKEYPNHVSHTLNGDADVQPPRKLTPAFYGCYDWHSTVHGHWLLARLARVFPNAPFAAEATAALKQSITKQNIDHEIEYLNGAGRTSFERPYGLAWLLQLGMELREWDSPDAKQMAETLRPLEQNVAGRLKNYLPKLSHPIREGEHPQTAFALGLILDSAKAGGDKELYELARKRARDYFFQDKQCPLAYEPSGEDFLSPCLAEADVMRRVLSHAEFATWLKSFLPQIPLTGTGAWLRPEVVTDPSDPRLAHLDGLNLSRAWMLEGIASALPPGDKRLASLNAAAAAHHKAGVAAVTGEHYEGGHWLGSYAVYLVTRRGIE